MDTTKLSDYDRGVIAGMKRYAHWKGGVQYVGTCGNTLEAAVRLYIEEDSECRQQDADLDRTLHCSDCGEPCEITKDYTCEPPVYISSCCREDIRDGYGYSFGWVELGSRYREQQYRRQEDSCG